MFIFKIIYIVDKRGITHKLRGHEEVAEQLTVFILIYTDELNTKIFIHRISIMLSGAL